MDGTIERWGRGFRGRRKLTTGGTSPESILLLVCPSVLPGCHGMSSHGHYDISLYLRLKGMDPDHLRLKPVEPRAHRNLPFKLLFLGIGGNKQLPGTLLQYAVWIKRGAFFLRQWDELLLPLWRTQENWE